MRLQVCLVLATLSLLGFTASLAAASAVQGAPSTLLYVAVLAGCFSCGLFFAMFQPAALELAAVRRAPPPALSQHLLAASFRHDARASEASRGIRSLRSRGVLRRACAWAGVHLPGGRVHQLLHPLPQLPGDHTAV